MPPREGTRLAGAHGVTRPTLPGPGHRGGIDGKRCAWRPLQLAQHGPRWASEGEQDGPCSTPSGCKPSSEHLWLCGHPGVFMRCFSVAGTPLEGKSNGPSFPGVGRRHPPLKPTMDGLCPAETSSVTLHQQAVLEHRCLTTSLALLFTTGLPVDLSLTGLPPLTFLILCCQCPKLPTSSPTLPAWPALRLYLPLKPQLRLVSSTEPSRIAAGQLRPS